MKNFIFPFCFLFTSLLHSQEIVTKEYLLNNKDISWVGEYEVILPIGIDIKYNESAETYWTCLDYFQNNFTKDTLKIENFGLEVRKIMDMNSNLCYYLYKAASDWKFQIYKDSDLKSVLTKDSMMKLSTDEPPGYHVVPLGVSVDTLIKFDPEKLSDELIYVFSEPKSKNVFFMKAKIYVYFNSLTMHWQMICNAIAPLKENYNGNGSFIGYSELFWMPVSQSNLKLDYKEPNYTYANFSFLELDLSKAKVLKSTETNTKCLEKMIDNIKNNPSKMELYEYNTKAPNLEESYFGLKYPVNQLKDLGKSVDTVLTFNEENLKEIMSIKTENLTNAELAKFIQKMRFFQYWYWDNKEKKLKLTPIGYGIKRGKFSDKGEFIGEFILFNQKTYKEDNPSPNSKGK